MKAPCILLAGAAALTLSACGDKDAPPPAAVEEMAPEADPARLAAEAAARSAAFLADNARRDGVKVTQSGLQYEVLSEGPAGGYRPIATDLVDVHYVGTLIDGKEFDSSRARGAAARFPLNHVIDGWTEGVQLMRVGDRYRFFIPSDLAYGETGTPGGPIGPNEALIFDVELLKATNAERNLAASKKFLDDNAKKAGVKKTASGLQYEVLAAGPAGGASPTDADVVRVHYVGTLIDGEEFDSSHERGEPAEFPLARVIPGWTEGVQLMRVGDKYRFVLPPDLAYGETGTPGGPIGPNEALVFEVELLEVK